MRTQPKLAIATKSTAPTYVDVFLERHRRLVEMAATIVLATIKDEPRITKAEVMEELRESSSLRSLLRPVKDYRLSDWLSTANVMGAFYDYGIEMRPGIGFTFIVSRKQIPKNGNVYDLAMAKVRRERATINSSMLAREQRDFVRELNKLKKDAGL
jgi:hypothetical protein